MEKTAANSRDMQDANKYDATVVAVTRDGRVYFGTTNVQKSKIFRNKYLVRLLLWVGEASHFFLVRILRLPYLMDKHWYKRKRN